MVTKGPNRTPNPLEEARGHFPSRVNISTVKIRSRSGILQCYFEALWTRIRYKIKTVLKEIKLVPNLDFPGTPGKVQETS